MSQTANLRFPKRLSRSNNPHFKSAPLLTSCLMLIVSLALSLNSEVRGQSSSSLAPQISTRAHSQQFPRQPQGSDRCVLCHKTEVDGYANSAMAHSLRHAQQEPQGTVNISDGKITAFPLPPVTISASKPPATPPTTASTM